MDTQTVSSSNVRAVGYDAGTQTLEVEFLNGGVYQYYSVPEQVHVQFMRAASKGQFLHYYIKNRYPYSRVA
jgi:hypothetical protein